MRWIGKSRRGGNGGEAPTVRQTPAHGFETFSETADAVLETLQRRLGGSVAVVEGPPDEGGVLRVLASRGDRKLALGRGSRSSIRIPLDVGPGAGKGSRALCAASETAGAYERAELELLDVMARVLASQLEQDRRELRLRHLIDRLEEHAATDPLTGVANRSSFVSALERHWRLSERGTVTAHLVVADLDGLKRVNDRYGHRMGDMLLKDAAQALVEAARGTDIIGRLGGDEFAALLIGCEQEADAAAFSLRFGDLFAEIVEGWPVEVDVSIGFHSLADSPSADHALEAADQAMDRAKRGVETS